MPYSHSFSIYERTSMSDTIRKGFSNMGLFDMISRALKKQEEYFKDHVWEIGDDIPEVARIDLWDKIWHILKLSPSPQKYIRTHQDINLNLIVEWE